MYLDELMKILQQALPRRADRMIFTYGECDDCGEYILPSRVSDAKQDGQAVLVYLEVEDELGGCRCKGKRI